MKSLTLAKALGACDRGTLQSHRSVPIGQNKVRGRDSKCVAEPSSRQHSIWGSAANQDVLGYCRINQSSVYFHTCTPCFNNNRCFIDMPTEMATAWSKPRSVPGLAAGRVVSVHAFLRWSMLSGSCPLSRSQVALGRNASTVNFLLN